MRSLTTFCAALLALSITTACTSVVSTGRDSTPPATSPSDPTPPPTDPGSTSGSTSGSTPSTSPVADDLSAAGVLVVADEAAAISTRGLVVTETQVSNMTGEARRHDGVLGADLDRLSPAAPGQVPLSYLLGAWITVAPSDAARRAGQMLGAADFHRAPAVRFPSAVLELFTADVAQAMRTAEGTDPTAVTSAPLPANGFQSPAAVAAADGPCSAVADFVDRALSAVFDALRISPAFFGANGPASALAGFLTGLWNTAVGFAQGVVQGLVSTLTQPIVDAIRVTLGVVGVATTVLSYVKTWSLDVRTDPDRPGGELYRFAIGNEPDRPGSFVASVPSPAADWPAALRDCADRTGVALPQLVTAGAPATWNVDYDEGVITPTSPLTTTMAQDLTARLAFVTGHEPADFANGEQVIGTAIVSVKVPRKEITDFLDLARTQVANAEQALLARVPAGVLHDQASAALAAYVQPTIDELATAVQTQADGVFSLRGEAVVAVTHHQPTDPSTSSSTPPTSSPTTDPADGTFCTQLEATFAWLQPAIQTALAAIQAAAPDTAAMAAAGLPLYQGMVQHFIALRAIAPAALQADLDVAISYGQVMQQPIGSHGDIALRYQAAGARIATYGRDVCHIDITKYHLGTG